MKWRFYDSCRPSLTQCWDPRRLLIYNGGLEAYHA